MDGRGWPRTGGREERGGGPTHQWLVSHSTPLRNTHTHIHTHHHHTTQRRPPQDFAEATLKRRADVVPAALVRELLPSTSTPEAFEALMNEGQGPTVIQEAMKKGCLVK